MAGELVFNNPQSPLNMEGAKCDKCGTPSNPEDLMEQDGFLVNKFHGCYKRHSATELEVYSEMDEEDFPLGAQFGGK